MTDIRNPGEPTARDARPLLGFRVGVLAPWFPVEEPALLTGSVVRVLDDISHCLHDLGGQPAARNLYGNFTPVMRLVSRLNEGPECLVAQAALARHWRLAAALPTAPTEAVPDTHHHQTLLPALLAACGREVVELDGDSQAPETALALAGRFVLRHSDVIIAITDGGHKDIRDLLIEAHELGIPVITVGTQPPHAVCHAHPDAPDVGYQRGDLVEMIRRAVLPTWKNDKRNHQRAAEIHFLSEAVRETGTAPDFLWQGPFAAPPSVIGWVYPTLNALLSPRLPPAERRETPPPIGTDVPAARTCYLHFQRADALATHYAAVHRSGFVLLYLCGSLSLAAAFSAQFMHELWPDGSRFGKGFTVFEVVMLLTMWGLYATDRNGRWRERWLDYRTLAELLRQADLLVQIGYPPLTGCLNRLAEEHPERGWVPWVVAAIIRSVGVAGGRQDDAFLQRVLAYTVDTRLADQLAYHKRTEARNGVVSKRLRAANFALFFAAVGVVALELIWPEPWDIPVPGLLAGVLPAFGAASFGIRNQAEFEIVVGRSERLHELLTAGSQRIARLAKSSLNSTLLGSTIQHSVRLMQHDAVEWAAIFEVKETEPG